MVQTRGQKNAAPQSLPPAQQQPAPQQAVPQKPRKAQKPKGTNKKKPSAVQEDDEFEPENEDATNDADEQEDDAPKPKPGEKRRASVTSAGSRSKVPKVGAAGLSGRNTPGPEPPRATRKAHATERPAEPNGPGDAVVPDQGKSKGNGKGKEKEVEPASNDRYISGLDFSGLGAEKKRQQFLEARAAQQKAWSQQPPDFNSSVWKGAAELGAGAYGAAFVFYCEDADGIVNDRIAVKDTVVAKHSWLDWTKWWGDPRHADLREHMEIKVMKDIASRAKEGRCVLWRSSTNYDDLFTYRIIMNYCPAGALHDAIPAVEEPEAKRGKKSAVSPPEVYDDGFDVPESLLWKWFEDLARACQLLEEGMDLSNDPIDPRQGHHWIVHRDIKPNNVFLDVPSGINGDWPAYPVATLGDFGSAIYTRDDDENNPMSYNYYQGTDGFRPLELSTVCDSTTKRYVNMGKLGSATNIWAIGASIMALCNREPHPKTNPFNREDSVPTFNANAQQKYSTELRHLLSACVHFRGEDRIRTQELLDAISQHTAGTVASDGDEDLADGMRAGNPSPKDEQRQWRWPKKERYRLGLSHDEGERQRAAEQIEEDKVEADRVAAEKKRKEERRKAEAEAAKVEKATKAAEAKAKRQATAAAKKGGK